MCRCRHSDFNYLLLLTIDPTAKDEEMELPGVEDEAHDRLDGEVLKGRIQHRLIDSVT